MGYDSNQFYGCCVEQPYKIVDENPFTQKQYLILNESVCVMEKVRPFTKAPVETEKEMVVSPRNRASWCSIEHCSYFDTLTTSQNHLYYLG